MFKEGNILYFTPFYFKNGNTAKNKYFVVLRNVGNTTVLASLPTRRDSVPEKDVVECGCVEIPEINFNCFVIPPNVPVTECSRCLDFKTYIYGYQLDSYELVQLNELYQLEGTDYEFYGKMKEDLFRNLIACLKNSKAVKRKYKRLL